MAGQVPDFEATERTNTGKGAARQARRDGLVPGVVYGGGEDPVAINVPFNVLFKKLKAGRFLSTLFNLKMEGHDHLDFMRLKRTTKINLFIGVEFANEDEAPGLKKGGILTVVRPEVELVVTAGDIPENITVDLTGLEIGDTITINSVDLPAGAKPTIDRDFVIANIQAPASLSSGDDEDEGGAAETEDAAAAEGGEE